MCMCIYGLFLFSENAQKGKKKRKEKKKERNKKKNIPMPIVAVSSNPCVRMYKQYLLHRAMDTFWSLRDTHLVSMILSNFAPPPILSMAMVTALLNSLASSPASRATL